MESFPTAYGRGDWEGVLAVSETIRTRASFSGLPFPLGAGEYTLSGDPTGHGYLTPLTGSNVSYDGTTDGTYNYFVDHLAGSVYMTDYTAAHN